MNLINHLIGWILIIFLGCALLELVANEAPYYIDKIKKKIQKIKGSN